MEASVSWEEISKAEAGTIFKDVFDDGVRFIIMKGGSSLCAYVGIPEDHPLSGFDYERLPVSAHGGLTFSGQSKYFPEHYWWYGWDYSHSGDYATYYDRYPDLVNSNDKKWLVKDVEDDSYWTISDFKKLMSLAERIAKKTMERWEKSKTDL